MSSSGGCMKVGRETRTHTHTPCDNNPIVHQRGGHKNEKYITLREIHKTQQTCSMYILPDIIVLLLLPPPPISFVLSNTSFLFCFVHPNFFQTTTTTGRCFYFLSRVRAGSSLGEFTGRGRSYTHPPTLPIHPHPQNTYIP